MAGIITQWDHAPHRPAGGNPLDPFAIANECRKWFENGNGAGMLMLSGTVACAYHGMENVGDGVDPLTGVKKTNRKVSQSCFACRHVFDASYQQESYDATRIGRRPVYWMPGCWYACEKCKIAVEDRRYNFDQMVVSTCWSCVQAMITWIKKDRPDMYVDLNTGSGIKGWMPDQKYKPF